jgi:hypothetical protein
MVKISHDTKITHVNRGLQQPETPFATVNDVIVVTVLPFLYFFALGLRENHFNKFGRSFGLRYGDPPAIARGIQTYYGQKPSIPVDEVRIVRDATALSVEKDMQLLRWSGRRRAPAFLPSRLCGQDIIASAVEKNNGIVLWVADFLFASWAAKSAFAEAGYRVWHMTSPAHGVSNSRFGITVLNPIGTRVEDRYLAGRIVVDRRNPAAASLRAARRLAAKGIVSITANDWEGARVLHVPFGRAIVPIANGAPALAHLSGATLIPVVAVRAAPAMSVEVVALEPIEPDRRLSRAAWADAAALMFVRRIDPFVQRYPEQWGGWRCLVPAAANDQTTA